MSKPRCAHYQLAHVAFRSIAMQNPLEFMSLMVSEKARDFVASLLEQVAEHCSEPPDFDADDVTLHRTRVLGSPLLVIEMPETKEFAEAHFAAAWLAVNDGPEASQLRYFTLEASDPAFGHSTVLGEWEASGEHVSYGSGSEPTLEAFVAAITAKVARYH